MLLRFLKFIGQPLFLILFSVEFHGVEHVPTTGRIIIAGNHPSYLDPVLVMLPVKRTIRFMGWDALFKIPILGWLFRKLGAFPVDIRRGKGEKAYLQARRILEEDQALGIFPEGQRSDFGPMGQLKTGIARLAVETGAPIVPVTIGGAFRAWPKFRLLPKPAKIIVRFHEPIYLPEAERAAKRDDKVYLREVMQRWSTTINRCLTPALHGDAAREKLYKQPPAHIRTYEVAPLAAALITTLIVWQAQRLGANWRGIWLLPLGYYVYLIADLQFIKPSRFVKWLRNSMPVWLILLWHQPLTNALNAPQGVFNEVLAAAVIAAFFAFFWVDYYTMQKFVRGLITVYYFSLLFLVRWPQTLGLFVAVMLFIALFTWRYRTLYYPAVIGVMLSLTAIAIWVTGAGSKQLFIFAALAAISLAYLQTFASVAYDIRRTQDVPLQHSR